MSATPEEVNAMARLKASLSSLDDGTAAPAPRGVPAPAEKMIRIYDEFGSWTEVPESIVGTGPMTYNENDVLNAPVLPPVTPSTFADPFAAEYIDDNLNFKPSQAATQNAMRSMLPPGTKEWVLRESESPEHKKAKVYSVHSSYTGNAIIDGIMMYESAASITNLLNEGKPLSDTKVLGIISSGLLYSSVLKEGLKLAKKRQAALNNKDYQAAMEMDAGIDASKEEANELRESVLKYLKDEGYLD